jgi:hypothetical protein
VVCLYRAARVAPAFCLILVLICSVFGVAGAQASSSITGTVIADGKPVPNATVTLTGNNLTLRTQTDATGAFAFNALTVGTYTLSTPGASGPATADVNLTSTGATVSLDASALQEIGRARVNQNPVSRSSGTDVAITGEQLSRAAVANSLPDILLQAPTAARGSNGQVHLNGDHNGINYVVDGVQIPEGLNRVLGNEIDPSNIGFGELIEGAYPAQYGDRFAGVFNISTKSKTGPAGVTFDQRVGSYNLYDTVIGLHTPVGPGGALYAGARFFHDGWALDPPVPNPVHDAGSIASQFVRYSVPVNGGDTLSFDLTHSLQTFQIPPDTSSGTPASADDNERQEDTFASLIYRHAFGDRGVLAIGPSYKRSRILDTNDLQADLAGQVSGPNAGACATFLDCRFLSVFADRTDINVRMSADYVYTIGKHEIRAGGIYGAETLQKNYVITVPATPDGTTLIPFTVTDTAPNVGHTQEFYLQDGWQIDRHWRLDYGVRADAFQVFSASFDNGFSQISPRSKLTYAFSPRANVYGYYGRLFVPFSLESVSPVAAAMLNAGPGTPVVAGTNDLKPQRDSLYEIGGHLPLGAGSLGVRISHKVSTDWLDDTQVGATNLHQDINFPRGLVDSQTLSYNVNLRNNGRVYASVSHVVALNSLNCETQLLQNCASGGPAGGDLVQADHDQHYDASAGVLVNDKHNGWFSFDGEYGSGLSLGDPTRCPPFPGGDAVNCKVPPHLTFDVAKGFALGGPNVQLAFAIRNLLNDRYAITLDSALQGTHFARPRTFELRLFLGGTRGG